MNRLLLIAALLSPASRGFTQSRPTTVPVIYPKITTLGTVFDTTADGALMPQSTALSPNGRLVAYSTDRDLRLWNVTTRASTQLLPGATGDVQWSPAGDAIVIDRPDDQGAQSFVWTMRVDPTTGKPLGAPQRVSLGPTTGSSAQFSPDSKLIAYPRYDSQRASSLTVVPANGGAERTLAHGWNVRRIRWSSDGSTIYYVSRIDSLSRDYAVFRVPVGGGSAQRVHDAVGAIDAPVVMRDARLLFPGPGIIDWSMRTLADLSGRPSATLALPPDTWSDESSGAYRMLAVREARPRALYLLDLNTGSRRDLVDTTSESGAPAWFHDGKRVAVIAKHDDVFSLITFGVDGKQLTRVKLSVGPMFTSTIDGRFHAELRISPDDRYATYLGVGRQSLELVELTSGKQRTLIRSAISVSGPVWRSDSRSIRYVLDGTVPGPNTTRSVHEVTVDGADKLVRSLPFSDFPGPATVLLSENLVSAFGQRSTNHIIIPLDGKPPRVMLPTSVQGAGQLSPDGRTIAIPPGTLANVKPANQLALESLVDGSVKMLDLPFEKTPFVAMQYHPDGRSLFIESRKTLNDPVIIHSLPIDGGVPREVARVSTNEPVSIFAVSPDGRYVAFTVGSTPRATFLSLDFSEPVAKLSGGPGKK